MKVLNFDRFSEVFFFTLLENYHAKTQDECSIDKTDLCNFLLLTGQDLILAEKKSGFGKSNFSL